MSQLYGFCVDCEKTRALTVHGRCGNCNSDAVMQRRAKLTAESEVEVLERLYAQGESK